MQHLAEIHDDHAERATVPQRRTGWLDRELDYETAPGHVRHKLYDLDHRKYDAASAQFLSVDPLWPMFISSGSYVYCTGDAINNVDPWGLGPDNPLAPTPKPKQSPKPKPSSPLGPPSPMVTGHGDSYENAGEWVFDIRYGLRLSMPGELGDGMGPQGNGPGVSVLTPPGGIGPGGKGGVGGLPLLSASAKGFAASSWSWEVRRDKARWVSDERSLREAANAARGKDYSPNPYLINNSSFVIYFKPDYDMVINGRTYSGSGAYALPPYMSWHYPLSME
jgi:RHS repeat-associated protein